MSPSAVLYSGPRDVAAVTLDTPPPGQNQVQIAVAYTGICGTDLHIYHGDMDSRVHPPGIIGHEMSGTIAVLGANVSGWSVGDRVTVMPLDWCGECPACAVGHTHICHNLTFIGIDSTGAMQSRWNVHVRTLVRLPNELDLSHAALVEPTAVAVHDVRRAALTAGERVVVVGAGPVGVLIGLVAARFGADVLILDLDEYRLDVATKVGLRAAIPDAGLQPHINAWTGGAGANVAFEVSGSADGVSTAVESLAVRGRLIQVGIHAAPREVNLHRFFWRELELLGARLYQRDDFEEAVCLVSEGAIPADQLISRIEPMESAPDAFAALERADGVMKILIDCTPGTAVHGSAS